MEKISSILPSNARIKSVDMKTSHAARPGAPAFGRMMGRTSSQDVPAEAVVDRANFGESKAANESLAAGYNPKEARHAKIAEDLTRSFFETRLQPSVVDEIEDHEVSELPAKRIESEVVKAVPQDLALERESLDVYA